MEHIYFSTDMVPFDIWRLIFKQLEILDLRSFNMINKNCNAASKYYLNKQKLWMNIYCSAHGLNYPISCSILPSKLFKLQQAWEPQIIPRFKANTNSLKVLLVGDGGVGKTSYVRALLGDEFDPRYLVTIGVDIRRLLLDTSRGKIEISFWDTAGPEKFGLLRDQYYMGAHAAIIVCDITSRVTLKNIPLWYKSVRRVCPDIPIAFCPNKIDAELDVAEFGKRIRALLMWTRRYTESMYCEISNKAQYRIFDPITWICRQATGDAELEVKFPPVASPTAQINPAAVKQMIRFREKRLPVKIQEILSLNLADPNTLLPNLETTTAKAAMNLKRDCLERVLKSCSPRLRSVMSGILTGVRLGPLTRTQNAYQRPSLFYIEGLAYQEFHAADRFQFLAPFLEFYSLHKYAIISEVQTLLGLDTLDLIESSVSKQGAWKAFYFLESGARIDKNHETAPMMSQLLTRVNSKLMACSFGYAYISILDPKAHITPHCGPCNMKLRCHLPLIVPNGGDCSLRVGSTTKQFKGDELLIFDDSIEHEVRNDSEGLRVVLLFDIWHPDLTEDEIRSITTYFS